MEEKLIMAVGNHPVLYDQSLFTYRDTNRRSQAWREVAETVVGFRLFGEFISSLLWAFLLCMSGAGDSCDWLLVALLAKNPQASDTHTSKIFLTLLCGRSVSVSWYCRVFLCSPIDHSWHQWHNYGSTQKQTWTSHTRDEIYDIEWHQTAQV